VSNAHPPAQLHLPDLPEVSVQLGRPGAPAAPRPRQAWAYRLQQALSSYLPLLLMAVLAAGTWWLIKHTPQLPGARDEAPVRQTPDYTMNGFSITRFGPDGRVVLRIAGDTLRHFPATDRLEIEGVRIHAIGQDGRVTDATARQALANGDGSEVQLLGGARITSQFKGAELLEVQGEFLHAFLRFERIRSHLPVSVRQGGTDARAGGLEYDHLQQILQLKGPVRATLLSGPRARAKPVSGAASAARPATLSAVPTRPRP
jgi:lipopolysaccharide export system protein LptC